MYFVTDLTKTDLERRALAAVRDYGVHLTLFRNAMNEWAGLNTTDMECLRLLFAQHSATPSELARHTGLTSGATTAMLDRLEKASLIERQPNPNDRRGTLVSPTSASREKVAAWFASARDAQAKLIASYAESELAIIVDVFEQFAKLWDDERGKLQKDP
jgi:DNA-binding MarR family transcriptional regulator